MEKIFLSDAGPKVSPAIYGFWHWEETANGGVESMEKIVNLCLELGINTFDHADIYGGYECEELFGKVMSQRSFKREDVVLFTKCGLNVPNTNRPDIRVRYLDTSAKHINESVDSSLKKLKTDYIDIFFNCRWFKVLCFKNNIFKEHFLACMRRITYRMNLQCDKSIFV